MFKKTILMQSLLIAIVAPSAVLAEVESTVELKNETFVYTQNGQTIGQATSQVDTSTNNGAGDLMKFQNQAKIFLNGDVGEESSWHAELQIIYDSEAIDDSVNGGLDYKGYENNTQQDYLRELYVDTTVGDWDLRLGKQQVVWGTADGIKLLDIINPTDFREVNQNTTEDARIPIWMINAEKNISDTANVQFVISEVAENKIPGLNAGGDQGQGFVMKGVDTITGDVNGFLNIAPALGKVATSFHNSAAAGSFSGAPLASGLTGFSNLTVDGFAAQGWNVTFPGGALGANPLLAGTGAPAANTTGSTTNPLLAGPAANVDGIRLLNAFANEPTGGGPNADSYQHQQLSVTGVNGVASTVTWNPSNPKGAFDYMPNATFTTFNTFAGAGATAVGQITTQYVVDDSKDNSANASFRYKNSLDNGFNYSLNYSYHYDANPAVAISWHDSVTGEKLTTELRAAANAAGGLPTGAVVARSAVPNSFANATASTHVSVLLKNAAGQYYGQVNPTTGATGDGTHAANSAVLRFTEYKNRINSFGSSFDYAMDTDFAPLVIRGEFLYDKNVLQPVVDKRLLGIGDLEGALQMREHDMFKYVLGLDATVNTNLLISGQFIQFINLDYIDESRTCTTQFGSTFDCSRYTADPSTMHLSNGLQKGWETKEFYSLFFSKPIGEDQLGRWNNITIFEEGGGWWNRLDADYSVTDQLIVGGEINAYWGDENTTFGQLKKSSNIGFNVKYIFEDL